MENESIAQKIIDSGGKLRVRSALNPALWLCGIVFVPSMLALSQNIIDPPWWLVLLAFLPVVSSIFGFFFLLFFDRDKLQSEDYQIKKQSLELSYQKGSNSSLPMATIDISSNPEVPHIENWQAEK